MAKYEMFARLFKIPIILISLFSSGVRNIKLHTMALQLSKAAKSGFSLYKVLFTIGRLLSLFLTSDIYFVFLDIHI